MNANETPTQRLRRLLLILSHGGRVSESVLREAEMAADREAATA